MRRAALSIAGLLFLASCQGELRLVELLDTATTNPPNGASESLGRVEKIALADESRRAILFPFPATLSFPLELPSNGELVFSIATLTERRVPRGRVVFRINLAVDGRGIEVYRREMHADDQNAWVDERVDLGAWGGRNVTVELQTQPLGGDSQVPWANRIRTAWGEPRIRVRDTAPLGAAERPSFIVLLVDTLRPDFLGAYGFDGAISPSLDRLAAESLLFENCFANAPWTKPSVASLFTSLHPAAHGVNEIGKPDWSGEGARMEVLPSAADTLAERFQRAGYRTAAFITNPFVSPRYGFAQGFEIFEPLEETEAVLASARRWLDEVAPVKTPFFLYLHFMDVHGPYDAPRQDFEAVLREMTGEPPTRLGDEELRQIPAYLRDTTWEVDDEPYRLTSWRAKYGAGVHLLDRKLRRFLDELRTSGVLDRSYLILTSDHGEELMEHGGWNHGENLYDHQLHVPLLVRKPLAVDAGRRVGSLVSLVDLMPTLLALGGVKSPAGTSGRDLSSLIRDEERAEVDAAIFASAVNEHPGVYGVRTRTRKLILNDELGEVQLFDVVADPREKRDLSSLDESSLAPLKELLLEHLVENEARSLSPETVPLLDETRARLKALGYVN